MTKITEKQLIESLSQLKEIKPRKEWAVLLKSQILSEKQAEVKITKAPAQFAGIMDVFSSAFFQKKIAYSFAAFVFVIVGLIGFARYTVPGDLLFPVKKMAEQSQAALSGQTGLKQNVVALSSRINDLAQVTKEGRTESMPSAINEITANAKDLAQNLKNNPAQDSQTIKDIATSLKTLADVPGTDLSENADVKDLYQAVVQSQIADLQKITLTDDQKKILADAEDLYSQGKYGDAFEKIYSINNQQTSNLP